MERPKSGKNILPKILKWTERAGNALPHPATLFALFALTALILSAVGYYLNWEVIHPGTQEIINPVNLLSRDGIHRIIVAFAGTFVTEKIVEPQLGKYTGDVSQSDESFDKLNKQEKKGLLYATLALIVILGLAAAGLIPENGFFRGENGGLLNSPLIKGVVAILLVTAGAMGLVYGFITGSFKNDSDVMITDSMDFNWTTVRPRSRNTLFNIEVIRESFFNILQQ